MGLPYDEYEHEDAQDSPTHVCRRCGKAGLRWGFEPGSLTKRVLWEKRPRGHNGLHECDLLSHFEDEA